MTTNPSAAILWALALRRDLLTRFPTLRWCHAIAALLFVAAAPVVGSAPSVLAQQAPAGQMVMAWHVTIAPSWFDPSTAPPQITPFGMLYALHDALVRPYPGYRMGNSLAESWRESPDGRVYEFTLRRGLKFHNGDPLTTEDVKFSFERYKGAGAKELQARVAQLEIVDPLTVRFHLTAVGNSGNAASRVQEFIQSKGSDAYGGYPDIDDLFQQQARERDRKKREVLLFKIQQHARARRGACGGAGRGPRRPRRAPAQRPRGGPRRGCNELDRPRCFH